MGRPLVWFPNIVFRMVRSVGLRPNQLAFRVPLDINKLEIRGFVSFFSSFLILTIPLP